MAAAGVPAVPAAASQRPVLFVVRRTFLEVAEELEGACPELGQLGRAATDTALVLRRSSSEPYPLSDLGSEGEGSGAACWDDAASEAASTVTAASAATDASTVAAPASPAPASPASGPSTASTPRAGEASDRRKKATGTAPRPAGDAGDACDAGLAGPRPPPSKRRTTVMLRNLPNNYTRPMLLAMLDREGFRGQYDFVYLPVDFQRKAGLGYAFVNLVDASVVPAFWKAFDGFSRWVLPSAKVCAVGWSEPHQGLRSHVERYRNSPVMHPSVPDGFKPLIFSKGVRQPFPAPTRPVPTPGARR